MDTPRQFVCWPCYALIMRRPWRDRRDKRRRWIQFGPPIRKTRVLFKDSRVRSKLISQRPRPAANAEVTA